MVNAAAPFSIGTTSTAVPGAAQSMDMSLGRYKRRVSNYEGWLAHTIHERGS